MRIAIYSLFNDTVAGNNETEQRELQRKQICLQLNDK